VLRALDTLAAAVFAPSCAACGRLLARGAACAGCLEPKPIAPPWCGRCGEAVTHPVASCGRCEGWKSPLVSVRSALWLAAGWHFFLQLVKHGGRFELLPDLWARALPSIGGPPVTGAEILAVPMHPARLAARGFDQADWLARRAARLWEMPPAARGLAKLADTPPQSTLTSRARATNLNGAFAWDRKTRPPRRVLLIDDVFTTGATLRSCAHALARAGCGEISAWTPWRVPRKFRTP